MQCRTAYGVFCACYLTDVGADAGLPEALTAELHCHLAAHGVLLTDLLKSFLPNNQQVNYWSAAAFGDCSHPQNPSLTSPNREGWQMQHSDINTVALWTGATGHWQLCWPRLIETLLWVSMAVGSGGGGRLIWRRQAQSLRANAPACPLGPSLKSRSSSCSRRRRNHYRHTHHVRPTANNWKLSSGGGSETRGSYK